MIHIDYRDPTPLYEQIIRRFEELILKGVLPEGSSLPSVRSLAMELSINPNTIQRAYAELEKAGWIESRQGKGSVVSSNHTAAESKKAKWAQKFQALMDEADILGISKEEILAQIEKEAGNHD
jgi:GntR family transcriptional regulator